uniref:Mg-protoporphyrin IX chelatase n=2 Tax=Ecklonia TaxID=105406 RepID=A0A8F0FA62_9PHAE|nr:magnesium-chelatase subunit I [Ecklonia radiata]YP_011006371.1 Magnesium chelatase subunit I [Ecklonia cava]YP_011006512.1 Magnesium chelatase subunit I [Eisenia bicyclis]QWK43202.1 photochlorophyllide reductase subunit I [Ecklonia arborea]QWK43486.1 photochlorophyllide reductase subunit I [Ecklonia radicosa]WAM63516.1 Magnesium chelatase subunit I [Ecklonia cava subsp. stolonifera]WAM63375.1 Magnesium chelatase subunit I [Ecklonia cava]WAM63657.1 Magnesium chelatase subunit I [Eisenia bi
MNKQNLKRVSTPIFPFTAIVGQEEMKLALELNVIDPKIGGVMIMGDRGTGKSTTIRAIADLLPEIEVIKDDPFNRHPEDETLENPETEFIKIPMVDLPLGATEDRVCGTIDIEKALTEGVKAFEPGLLAKANRGILYVDEVNLLDDHLVDILLDSAASGWNTVEREGISIRHPAQFVLVGSGNPEEGELRPQLLDRFGMHAEIRTVKDPDLRVRIVEERTLFDLNPYAWVDKYKDQQELLKQKIVDAQNILDTVELPYDFRVKISKVCSELDVDGLRGDIVTNRAAKAYAAFQGKKNVLMEDIQKIIVLCLRHRLRKDPLESIDSGYKVKKIFEEIFEII